ncbi:hypothetical protein HDU78_000775 [Chytriomyces hyalinus]|nr:hypothetical protein HDU78_000775 [Chytriomyces hyalinus]
MSTEEKLCLAHFQLKLQDPSSWVTFGQSTELEGYRASVLANPSSGPAIFCEKFLECDYNNKPALLAAIFAYGNLVPVANELTEVGKFKICLEIAIRFSFLFRMPLGPYRLTPAHQTSGSWMSLWNVVDSGTNSIAYRFKYIVGSQNVIWVREDGDHGQDDEGTAILHHQIQLFISEMESQLAEDSHSAVDETLVIRDMIRMSSESELQMGTTSLYTAVRRGNRRVVIDLLNRGLTEAMPDAMFLACRRGYTHIVKVLLHHGARATMDCLFNAVEKNQYSVAKVLLDNGAEAESRSLWFACQRSNSLYIGGNNSTATRMVNLLLMHGANQHVYQGELLEQACKVGNMPLVEELLAFGAHLSSKALKVACDHDRRVIAILLLQQGFRPLLCQMDDGWTPDMKYVVISHIKKTRWTRVRQAVRKSWTLRTGILFNWQVYAQAQGKHQSLAMLRAQARIFDIAHDERTSFRELCVALEAATSLMSRRTGDWDPEFVDFTGQPIRELPKWQVFVTDGYPFNFFDLLKLVEMNPNACNPFTGLKLDHISIQQRSQYLASVLTRDAFDAHLMGGDLLEIVTMTPIQSPESVLRGYLVQHVWDKLYYPGSIDTFMKLSKLEIGHFVDRMVIYMIQCPPGMYDMVPHDLLMAARMDGDMMSLAKIFNSVLQRNDEHSETRAVAMTTLVGAAIALELYF